MSNSFTYNFNITGNASNVAVQLANNFGHIGSEVNKVQSRLVNLGEKLLSLNAIPEFVSNVSNAFQGLVGSSLEFEQQQANLKTLLNGDAEATDRLVNNIREYGKATVYDRSSLIEAQKTMMAFGLEADFAFGKLKNIGDIALGDSEKMKSLSLAFAQTTSTGKLMGQDLLQMINAGFNPLEVISQKTGKSIAALKDEMSKGAISAEMVAQAFEWATEEGGRFYKGAESAAETTAGKIAKMNDTIDEMKVSLFEATGGATAWVAEIGTLAQPLSGLLGLMPLIKNGFGSLTNEIKRMNTTWKSTVKNVKSGILGIIMNLELTRNSLKLTGGAFTSMSAVAKVACKAIGTAIKTIPIVGWIAAAISLVITAFTLLWEKCEGFRRMLFGVWEVIKGAFNYLTDGFVPALSGAVEWVRGAFASVVEWLGGAWDGIVQWISSAFDTVAQKLGVVGAWISEHIIAPVKDFFASIWDFITDIFDSITARLGEVFRPIIELWNKLTGKTVELYAVGAEKGSESFRKSKAAQNTLAIADGEMPADDSGVVVPPVAVPSTSIDPTGGSLGNVGGSASSGSDKIKNVTVNIEKLVERFEIHTTNLANDVSKVKDMVSEALLSALNDVNLAV